MKDSVRIVLVGDENVGKTSIVEVLITEKFHEEVQPVLPVLVVPPNVTPENVGVSIVDTPGDPVNAQPDPAHIANVEAELLKADVVVLVYAVDSADTTSRVISHWLPKFRAMSLKAPVVLVGNKIDTRGGVSDPEAAAKMEAFIKPIMEQFREVDVCIECSAKTVSNISEVFYFAQKAVLYPTVPMYNVETQSLKPRAVAALRRIFKVCDKDGDGGLNDFELNEFQYTCFSVHLQPSELEGVKKVVKENRPTTGINADGSLSVEGFIFLHTLFVQKGRLETTWIVLRKFGYDDDLQLTLDADSIPSANSDQSVELSDDAKAFLKQAFEAADTDQDGVLSPKEIKEMFSECPDGPFSINKMGSAMRLVRSSYSWQSEGEHYSYNSFLARWTMYIIDNLEDAMLSLLHLGYGGELKSALRVTRSRRRDRNSRTVSREVIQIAVLGNEIGMKTSIVSGLVRPSELHFDQPDVMSAAKLTDGDKEKVIVMRSMDTVKETEVVTQRDSLDRYDILCVVFDAYSLESLEKGTQYVLTLKEKLPDVKLPIVFVAVVNEDSLEGSELVLQVADEFCAAHELTPAPRVSPGARNFGKLYEDLLGVAIFPQVACADYYDVPEVPESSSVVGTTWKITVGVVVTGAVAGAVGYGAKRLYDYYSTKGSSASS